MHCNVYQNLRCLSIRCFVTRVGVEDVMVGVRVRFGGLDRGIFSVSSLVVCCVTLSVCFLASSLESGGLCVHSLLGPVTFHLMLLHIGR